MDGKACGISARSAALRSPPRIGVGRGLLCGSGRSLSPGALAFTSSRGPLGGGSDAGAGFSLIRGSGSGELVAAPAFNSALPLLDGPSSSSPRLLVVGTKDEARIDVGPGSEPMRAGSGGGSEGRIGVEVGALPVGIGAEAAGRGSAASVGAGVFIGVPKGEGVLLSEGRAADGGGSLGIDPGLVVSGADSGAATRDDDTEAGATAFFAPARFFLAERPKSPSSACRSD